LISLETFSRYWQTVRWLRPGQVYGRLWFRLHGRDSFTFLNVERCIAAEWDWNRPDWPKLWLYNAHYFDDLAAADGAARTMWHRALVARWVVENPPGRGIGWEPYPTSLRIVNWVKWALTGNALDDVARQSLAVQTRFLRERLEIHLLGNHLWANAKALVFAGTFFDGAEAEAWRVKGLALLRRELEEQILPDGGHFERSPMYHAIVLENLLDLLQLLRVYPGLFTDEDVAAWREIVLRMHRWLRVMTHPDGGISFFNDAAFDIAPALAAITEYAAALGVACDLAPLADLEALADSGYVRLQIGPAVMIADVGEIGPDHLPGHAHELRTVVARAAGAGQRRYLHLRSHRRAAAAAGNRSPQHGRGGRGRLLRGLEQLPGGAPGAAARGDLGPGWRCTLAVGRTRGL